MAKKRADGRYAIQFRFEGKRYTVYGATMKEAKEAENNKRTELAKGLKNPKSITIEKWFDDWMEWRERNGKVRGSSQRTNEKHCRRACKQIVNGREFGKIKLAKLTAGDIRELVSALQEQFKPRTVSDTLHFIKQGLQVAVNDRLIEWNPCNGVEIGAACGDELPARDTIHRCLSEDEVSRFFEAAKESHYYGLYIVMMQTGMRVGEASAFYPEDIKSGLLTVNKTVTREKTGYMVRQQTKTEAGTRTIPLTKTAIDAIKNEIGEVVRINYPVFTMKKGGIIRPDRVNEDIAKLCESAGIEKFTCHAFRATFISRCIAGGMPIKELMEICGHQDAQMTLSLYAHSNNKARMEWMERVAIM